MRNTQNYKSLPYNPALKARAKELRRAGNLSEVLLWNQIKDFRYRCEAQLGGCDAVFTWA
jgi:very-short-patch-repair endonuclease